MLPSDVHSFDALRIVLRGLEAVGLDPHVELRRLGLPVVDEVPRAPVTRQVYRALWARMIAVAGRDDFGLDLAMMVEPGTVGPVEWLAATAPTVGAGLEQLARYGRLLHSGGLYAVERHGRRAHFIYHPGNGEAVHRSQLDWSFAYLARRLHRSLPTGHGIAEMRLQYPRPACAARVEEVFAAPVRFGAALNELVLPLEVLDHRLATHDADTHAAMETICRARCGPRRALVGRVEAEVLRALEHERVPGLQEVARTLGVGARSLQRELRASKVSFRTVVLRARMTLARRWLARPDCSVSDVAYRLAYSEPSALLRAYRQHYGHSWRADLATTGAPELARA